MRFICVCCVLLWSSARGMVVLNGTSVEASGNSERAGVDWDQGLETRDKSPRRSGSFCGLGGSKRKRAKKFETRGRDGFLHDDEKTCLKGMCCCCLAHWCNKIPYNAAVHSDPEDEWLLLLSCECNFEVTAYPRSSSETILTSTFEGETQTLGWSLQNNSEKPTTTPGTITVKETSMESPTYPEDPDPEYALKTRATKQGCGPFGRKKSLKQERRNSQSETAEEIIHLPPPLLSIRRTNSELGKSQKDEKGVVRTADGQERVILRYKSRGSGGGFLKDDEKDFLRCICCCCLAEVLDDIPHKQIPVYGKPRQPWPTPAPQSAPPPVPRSAPRSP
nr:PREDICTED: uncharacterized protein LOC109032667 [Bemisia tabaci]